MSKLLYNLEGIVKRHPDGFGFFIPDDKEKKDIFLPKRTMEGIMSNDRVLIKVFLDPKKNELYGDIQRVLSRFTNKGVGVFHKTTDKYGILLDKENHWGANLVIQKEDSKNAKENEWVEVEINTFPGHPKGYTGKVIQVIGHRNDPAFDTKRAIALHNIPEGFSNKAIEESESFGSKIDLKGQEHRVDQRDLHYVTIDGVTAKDFDDAVYVETNNRGFLLRVAIADVSHYVKPKTALDKDAYDKGNSSYFPMYVVPMLPEALSNELCSLKPKVDRLAMVAEIQMNFRGDFESYKFYEAIINSHARITYGEAQEIVDGSCPEKFSHVENDVNRAADLAKILMAKRFSQGSLDLDIPETEIILDESGTPIDIIKSERLFAHRLIEELMLAANVAVARYFEDHELNGIHRIHENPNSEKLKVLENFLSNFGTKLSLDGGKIQKKITKALKKYEGKPEHAILSQLTLRSMQQARYASEPVGHFGLAFDHYTHFTSPIRRYPDLLVHRILKAHIYGPKKGHWAPSAEELATASTHCSATEQRSVKAERFVQSVKRARFAEKLVGEEFDGRITSIARFGVFVGLRAFDIDGLVRIEELGNDYFIYDEEKLILRGERSGYQYKMGQDVRVLVAAANPELGQIDFQLADSAFTPSKKDSKSRQRIQKKTDRNRSGKKSGGKKSGGKKFSGKKFSGKKSSSSKKSSKSSSKSTAKKKSRSKTKRK